MNKVGNKIFIIECCNFEDFPLGGQLTFTKQLLTVLGPEAVLVGISTDSREVGKWMKKTIQGTTYHYFPYLYLPKSSKKPLVPLRLRNFLALRKYRKEIMEANPVNVMIQSPDTYFAVNKWGLDNICYLFSGTENPLAISRYKFARGLAFLYDMIFLKRIRASKLILAAADQKAIGELVERSKGSLSKEMIIQFPSRVDTHIYFKKDILTSRRALSIPDDQLMLVTTGRLGWFKGWKFMIDSLVQFRRSHPNAHLYFIGSGEDQAKIENYIHHLGLEDFVHLPGFKTEPDIATYLNAADLFVMGSYKEGWSTALIEAIACGVPVCVTDFSSAHDIVEEGVTGFISPQHDEVLFSALMTQTLTINRNNLPRQKDIDKYSTSKLRDDLLGYWKLEMYMYLFYTGSFIPNHLKLFKHFIR